MLPRRPIRPSPIRPDPSGIRDPRGQPPLRRGGPVAGADPTAPAATTPADVQQSATNAIRQIGGGTGAGADHGRGPRHIRPTSPEDDVGDLASLKQQHDAERAAAQQQLEASKAQALQTAAAKSGAAGFGLSGASAALQGDVGRAADRGAVLTMADLRGKQNDENFAELQREVALNAAEEDADLDMNHDGFIAGHKVSGKLGDGDPDNNPVDAAAPGEAGKGDRQKIRDAAQTIDLGLGGDDTRGSMDTPFLMTSAGMHGLEDQGMAFTDVTADYMKTHASLYGQTFGHADKVYRDQDGNYWFIRGGS